MSSIEVTAEQIQKGIFCQARAIDQLSIGCNWCGLSFFEGEDTDHPNTNWLVEMIIHFNEKHKDRM